LKRPTGIRGLLLRKAHLRELPTKAGPCELEGADGTLRWFVAAKLPRPTYLCDGHYLEIRDALEEDLEKILKDLLEESRSR